MGCGCGGKSSSAGQGQWVHVSEDGRTTTVMRSQVEARATVLRKGGSYKKAPATSTSR